MFCENSAHMSLVDMEVFCNAENRGNISGTKSGEKFLEQPFSGRKKGRGSAPSNKFETIEQTYPLPADQN